MKRTSLFLLFLPLMIFLVSCMQEERDETYMIGISKGAPEKYYGNYSRWLGSVDTNVICTDLYHMPLDSALSMLDQCSGLLLSGGPDVYPGRYGMPWDTAKCGSIDHFRDSLEIALIEKALEQKIPVLGICRGLQIFNIYQGGSLYAHLPTDLDTLVMHRCPDTYDCMHNVRINESSGLHETAAVLAGTVNSNHHQGIRKLGNELMAVARSDDGLIEAIEFAKKDNKSFFMGVQWHPERMDLQNPLSLPVAMFFLKEAKLYSLQHAEN